jgi:D-alanyl-D-alanine carboxypeptidase (penicillin-binding protein 5/6)
MKKFLLASIGLLVSASSFALATLDTKAKYALIMDYDTGSVMYEKQGYDLMVPASMSKLMTVYVLFDKLKAGIIKETDEFRMSHDLFMKYGRRAGKKNDDSTMFIEENQLVKVLDLLYGIIVLSGSDACGLAAEGSTGSEETFVSEMNRVAQEIGLVKSSFRNVTGLYDPSHLMTSYELAVLARHIIKDFPEYYKIFSEKTFTFGVDMKTRKPIEQKNRNPLLWGNVFGADGLKTGHLSNVGYGLTGSIKRNNRRIIFVINGLNSELERATESRKVSEWAFREFDNYQVFKKGDIVGTAPVWFGKDDEVDLEAGENALITLPKGEQKKIKAKIEYDSPIQAPVVKGKKVGQVTLLVEGNKDVIHTIPIYVAKDVESMGMFGRLFENLKQIVKRIIS